ncbi:D-alanine--D-alanine ligase [Nakamurella flavida]|uniref:D-alanine--D-alanine ligase n=1 Tax=Nakamurella flavida TaxID=363630 RepID=A0A938YJE9_9ACTN|nr:D-alanine--D-alanine ligase family protein [Nakamurella flavida]MBM9477082.1 D-alanine--D-alanine ligase [Nakamurella flavida]MDP9780028.1 D-alanine-D-alanine ligase [Nakamurella flavida]
MSSQRIRVAVLFGGRSGEHPVSCISAAGVLSHLDPAVFDVSAIGITPDGAWVRVDPAAAIAAAETPLPQITTGVSVVLSPDPTSAVITPAGEGPGSSGVDLSAALDVDVVFPVLHGPWGEDGTVQGLLELAGVPYVGNGVLASAAGMDKEFTKKLLAAEGLAVGDYVVLRRGRDTVAQADRARLGLPVFVKPARAGSSLGVSRVDDWAELDAAIAEARAIDPKVLVEAARIGREIECGVLEFPDGRVEASPTAEIGMPAGHEFYDFQAKYVDDVATFSIPAELPDVVTKQIQDMALRAFTALDAQGLARVDFFVTDGDQVVINEVNTLPGFTPISMFPRMWAAAGVGYAELVELLIRTALARGTGLR